MWPHFVNLLIRSWTNVLNSLGTTSLSIVLFSLAAPVITFIISLLVAWKGHPEKAFIEHAKKTIAPTLTGFAVPAAMIAVVFGWKTIVTVYEDHQALATSVQQLGRAPKPICPECPVCPKPVAIAEPYNSLRRRTIRLVQELNKFWSRRTSPSQMPVQNPNSDEDRNRNTAWDQYWREAKAEYLNANYKQRLIGIVREYKNKGIDVGYMEQAFEQPDRLVGAMPYGGWQLDNCAQYMNELCQLRELAYHVDAHDQPIFLVEK